jgi:hypothetical protein
MVPVDQFTKTILTVIAACLVWLSVTTSPLGDRFFPKMEAQSGVVVIGGIRYDDKILRFGQGGDSEHVRVLPVLVVK